MLLKKTGVVLFAFQVFDTKVDSMRHYKAVQQFHISVLSELLGEYCLGQVSYYGLTYQFVLQPLLLTLQFMMGFSDLPPEGNDSRMSIFLVTFSPLMIDSKDSFSSQPSVRVFCVVQWLVGLGVSPACSVLLMHHLK